MAHVNDSNYFVLYHVLNILRFTQFLQLQNNLCYFK